MTRVVVIIDNNYVNLEKFLEFWTQNNRLIIELTFGFIFILILFLIYRQFFSHETVHSENVGSAQININTAEIEEKLQKIMESQLNFKGQLGSLESSTSTSPSSAPGSSASADLAPLQKEVEALKEQLKSKDVKIEELAKAGAAAAAGAPSAAGAAAASPELEAKIKELEGRLQEYEIISEDIADLSFYKEENARLQKELADLKGGKPALEAVKPAPAAAPVAPTPVPAPAVAATPAPAVETPAPAAESAPGPVDDDIMKEFAAAIEDQKKTSPEPAKELEGDKLKESQQLMGDFENFLKKG